ncbi:MAG: hypothetical protein OXD47_12190 [Gammaproteobacteria bacterium]|nr:hypothetical protein [Gammaproteobacteria bacterium]MCY4210428.1 hypothetical protein [Gammaproteobacteria bacterium]MCY4281732.1 hypothetical protein [Gammaproteobacteria bacterium]MCY4339530.1 hypothetical protein [Gammaproteobacteria bacterium]
MDTTRLSAIIATGVPLAALLVGLYVLVHGDINTIIEELTAKNSDDTAEHEH